MARESSSSADIEESYGAIVICDAGVQTRNVILTETRSDEDSNEWYHSWPKGGMDAVDRKVSRSTVRREEAAILRELQEEAGLSHQRMEFLLSSYALEYERKGQNNPHRRKRIKLALMVTDQRGKLKATDKRRHRFGRRIWYRDVAEHLRHPVDQREYLAIRDQVVEGAVLLMRGAQIANDYLRRNGDICDEIRANIAAFRARFNEE